MPTRPAMANAPALPVTSLRARNDRRVLALESGDNPGHVLQEAFELAHETRTEMRILLKGRHP